MLKVVLRGVLKDFHPEKKEVVMVDNSQKMSLGELMAALGLEKGQVGVALVNGKVIHDRQYQLEEGSVVELHPIFGGG